MSVLEEKSILRRQNDLHEENKKLKMKNHELQGVYKKYLGKIDELEKI